MKKLLLFIIAAIGYFAVSAQVVTDTVPTIYGKKDAVILANGNVLSKQDTTGGAGFSLVVTPWYVTSHIANGSVNTVTVSAPITNSGTATNPILNIAQANGTTDGYLNHSDWTTFNSKLSANQSITFTASGDITGTASGSTAISPSFTLASVGTANTYAYPASVTTDAKGRVTSVTAGTAPFTTSGTAEFFATAAQTSFTVTGMPGVASQVDVYRNGVALQPTRDYTCAAGALTIVPTTIGSLAAGDQILVTWFK